MLSSISSRGRHLQAHWQKWRGKPSLLTGYHQASDVAVGPFLLASRGGRAAAGRSNHRCLHKTSAPPMGSAFYRDNLSLDGRCMNALLDVSPPQQTLQHLQFRAVSYSSRGSGNRDNQNRNNGRGEMQMRDCRSIEEIAQLANDNLDKMSPYDIGAFWTMAAKFVGGGNNRHRGSRQQPRQPQQQQLASQLKSMFLFTMGKLQNFRGKDLATTALAFAKISNAVENPQRRRFQGPNQNQLILRELLIGPNSKHHKIIFQSIANASIPLLSKFDARHLSNLAYAYAIVDFVPMLEDQCTLFDHIAEKSVLRMQDFNPQELANIVWAFAKVEESNPRLFQIVADHVVSLDGDLRTFKPQELANILWAFAKAGESNRRLFQMVADHIVSLDDDLREFKPQELTNIVWAFATAKESHPLLFHKVADHILSLGNMQSFNSRECSQLLWAFATADIINLPLFRKVSDHVDANINFKSLNERDKRNLIWAYERAFSATQKKEE